MKTANRLARWAKAIKNKVGANDLGMTTAEYAVGTVAAVAFAVVLFKVVQSPAVRTALSLIVQRALNVQV